MADLPRRRDTATRASCDVAIIGAGVVGCAVARDLSRFSLDVALLEANGDIGDGASKGNSAILATGADTPPGSLECELVRRGNERYRAERGALGLPFLPIGSLTVAWNEAEADRLHALCADARKAGFGSLEIVGETEIYHRAPHLAPGAVAAIWEPDEGIVDPFSAPFAYALDAVANGVDYRGSSPVTAARRRNGHWALSTPNTTIEARIVINCGGLQADWIDEMAGYSDFAIRPRRGQFLVFDKSARALLDVIVKPVPTARSRGILITPTVFGNVMIGPTSENVDDRDDRSVTRDGIVELREAARRMLPALLDHEVTATYAGLRPGTERPEYRIIPRPDDRWITVAGIRSTGLSGALGIAEHVARIVAHDLLPAQIKAEVRAVRVPNLCEEDVRPWSDARRIADDPGYGEIVCHCERVTLGELRDALASPVPPRSIKALKRRTRAMFGRCQGFFCGARVQAIFDEAERKRTR